MSWTKKITHPSEVVKKGDKVRCVVLSVDTVKKRIALGLKQLSQDPWMDQIPANYHVGDLLSGHVTKITNFGAFVRLEDDLEGLLHVSELSDRKIASPEEVVKPGMKVEVRVIRVDTDERKIGLSFVHSDFEENDALPPAPVEGEATADGDGSENVIEEPAQDETAPTVEAGEPASAEAEPQV
jgi:small subunit ribosomal protein S1